MATTMQSDITVGSVKNMVDRLSKDFTSKSTLSYAKPTSKPSNNHSIVVATFAYTPVQSDELALTVGDLIEVMEDVEDGWARGKNQTTGAIGAFPTNFVETKPSISIPKDDSVNKRPVNEDKPEAIKRTPSVVIPQSVFSSIHAKSTTEVEKMKEMAKVKFVYEPQNPDELRLGEIGTLIEIVRKDCGDAGWFEGELNGKTGLFPDNFVELVQVPIVTKSGTLKKDSTTPKVERPAKAPLVAPSTVAPVPPAVPAKPTKPKIVDQTQPPQNGSSAARPAVSTNFANIRSKLAQGLKVVGPGDPVPSILSKSTIVSSTSSEGSGHVVKRPLSSVEARNEEEDEFTQLQHITKDRPRPPGKRPTSMMVQKKKSTETVLDSPSALSDGGSVSMSAPFSFPPSNTAPSESSFTPHKSPAMKPVLKEEELPSKPFTPKKEDKPVFIPSSSAGDVVTSKTSINSTLSYHGNSMGDGEFVSRKEYNDLLAKMSVLEQRIAQLERNNR